MKDLIKKAKEFDLSEINECGSPPKPLFLLSIDMAKTCKKT